LQHHIAVHDGKYVKYSKAVLNLPIVVMESILWHLGKMSQRITVLYDETANINAKLACHVKIKLLRHIVTRQASC